MLPYSLSDFRWRDEEIMSSAAIRASLGAGGKGSTVAFAEEEDGADDVRSKTRRDLVQSVFDDIEPSRQSAIADRLRDLIPPLEEEVLKAEAAGEHQRSILVRLKRGEGGKREAYC